MQGRMPSNLESLKNGTFRKIKQAENSREEAYRSLVELRSEYLREYPNRTILRIIRRGPENRPGQRPSILKTILFPRSGMPFWKHIREETN